MYDWIAYGYFLFIIYYLFSVKQTSEYVFIALDVWLWTAMGYWSARLCAWRICEITVPILEKHEKTLIWVFFLFIFIVLPLLNLLETPWNPLCTNPKICSKANPPADVLPLFPPPADLLSSGHWAGSAACGKRRPLRGRCQSVTGEAASCGLSLSPRLAALAGCLDPREAATRVAVSAERRPFVAGAWGRRNRWRRLQFYQLGFSVFGLRG